MDSKALASHLPFSSSSSHRQFSGKDGKVALKNPSCDVESTPLPLLAALGKKKSPSGVRPSAAEEFLFPPGTFSGTSPRSFFLSSPAR